MRIKDKVELLKKEVPREKIERKSKSIDFCGTPDYVTDQIADAVNYLKSVGCKEMSFEKDFDKYNCYDSYEDLYVYFVKGYSFENDREYEKRLKEIIKKSEAK
jgi:hypothetical protein